ncbi:hypothetical protein UFOVP1229_46 [uncultured Caudovirales phage]|uniref:Uncharacterized protein n=1 Tax=uncultured Caudovirales phage TaxID=2100421 RepID=A0A6J5R3R0_9CAUD|nr:hypothetical protein UFOVP1229_46 [uncultured Caudovirales phage]
MKRPYYEAQIRFHHDQKWQPLSRSRTEQEARDSITNMQGVMRGLADFRIRPLPGQIDRPTVQCSIAETPSLRGRSYVSLYKDANGQPIPVSDLGKPKSQQKLRRIRRRQFS